MSMFKPSRTVTRLSFAASGTASGVISNGVAYFLLLYYSQVLGLDPALAGTALLIALIVDAVSDPLVGRWSDRLSSRWGRRHPFLFVSAVPVSLGYYFLWDVPELSQTGLFLYLLFLSVVLRLSQTLHVVPFNALLPEITSDYDERTSLMNYSYSASWFVGTIMAVAMYMFWLADTPEFPDGSGILRAEGYVEAGLIGGAFIFVCTAVAALGTYGKARSAGKMPVGGQTVSQMLKETRTTFTDVSFLSMLLTGLFGAASSGTSTALWAYMQPYFWGFDSDQISVILAAQLASAVIAFFVLPLVSYGRDKKHTLIGLSIVSVLVGSGPVLLRLMGWFPADETILFPLMVVVGVVQVSLIVMIGALTASMIADIVEARAVVTGRREEGLLYSVQSFVGKVASGVGVWAGGVLLAIIDFPLETATAQMDPAVGESLGWLYAPAVMGFSLISIYCLTFYRIDRQSHATNLSKLEAEGG